MDVNDPDNCKLLRYINLPYCAAWEQYQKVRDLPLLIAAVAQVYATDPSYAHLATAIADQTNVKHVVACARREELPNEISLAKYSPQVS